MSDTRYYTLMMLLCMIMSYQGEVVGNLLVKWAFFGYEIFFFIKVLKATK